MSNSIKFSKLFIGLILIFLFISGEVTFSQSSTNYKIEKSVIDQGGGVTQTNDKNINSVIGQASSSGSSISSNYMIFTGFFTGELLAGSNNLSGVVNYYSNSKPVKNVILKLNEITINSGNDGSYSFANLASSNYTLLPTKTGDINAAIGAYDASMILRYSVGLVTLTPQQLLAGDVSANGSVAAFDASYILRYTVGLITSFPVNAEWRFVPASFSLTNSNWNSAPDKINYSPLNSSQSNQNFIALVYGDVSGNWSPASLVKTSMGQATVSFGKLQSKDEIITLPVQADIRGELCAAELIFSVDAEKIKVQDVRLGEKLDGYHLAFSQENSKLRIAVAGAEPIHAQDVELINLNFEVKDPTSKAPINLELSEVILNEGQISTEILNKIQAIETIIPATHRLFQNSPNPFNPTTSIQYHLAETADVTLTIFDLSGKEVQNHTTRSQAAGYHFIQWDGKDLTGQGVASGMYFYRIEIKSLSSETKPFINVKKMILMK